MRGKSQITNSIAAFVMGAVILSTTASHWNFGPIFEWDDHPDLLAIRPFYAQARSRGSSVYDVLWPVSTFHNDAADLWWRVLVAWGDNRPSSPDWQCVVLPLWFSGRTREDDFFWGLFPIYGHHPHAVLLDDWRFVLWPVWQQFETKGVRSTDVLWPFFTWKEEPRKGIGVWPIFGLAQQRESRHGYALWPIFTWARYGLDRDTSGVGSSWMVWPLAAGVSRERESQMMFLPPFFGFAKTDKQTRWRMPWPLVEVESSSRRSRVAVLPFYERSDGFPYESPAKRHIEEHVRRYLWYFCEDIEITTAHMHETRFTIFPFWTSEKFEARGEKGAGMQSSFTRVWPFWKTSTQNGVTRHQVLDLVPIRSVGAIDRNWAPFWTFWSCETTPSGRTHHSLFWHLITWHTEK